MASQQDAPLPPPPGVFAQRVRNRLKTKELSFFCVQKSAQEYEKKEDRESGVWDRRSRS